MRPARKGPPPKVIVYSGFRTHAAVIDLALTSAGVNFENIARMGMTRAGKDAALASFRGDPPTARLLRARAARVCLSFVSRVFVMEPLDNASLEQQVVSRAHRMGQRGTVKVEVLAMRGTAEETLLDVQAELAAAAAAEARARERAHDQHARTTTNTRTTTTSPTTNTRTSTRKVASRRGVGRGVRGAGVEPAVAAEALSRRRVLQSLKLVPVPAAEDEDAAEAEAEANAVAANTAANVAANAKRALEAANGDAPKTAARKNARGDGGENRARRRAVMFAEDPEPVAEAGGGAPNGGSGARSSGGGGGGPDAVDLSLSHAGTEASSTNAANATPIRPRAASPPRAAPPPDTSEWRVRVRAVRAYPTDRRRRRGRRRFEFPGVFFGLRAAAAVTIRLPEGGATAVATLRRLAEEAFSAAAAPRSFAARALAVGIPPRPVADDADRASMRAWALPTRTSWRHVDLGRRRRPTSSSPNAAATAARTKTNASGSGTRLGGSPLAAGVGGVRPRVVDPSPPSSRKKRATTAKGACSGDETKTRIERRARASRSASARERLETSPGRDWTRHEETEGVRMASAAAAEMAGGGSLALAGRRRR